MRRCKRCQGPAPGTHDTWQLYGVTAHLCADCQTAFGILIDAAPEYAALRVLCTHETYLEALALAQQPRPEAEYEALAEELLAAGCAIKRLVRAWVNTPIRGLDVATRAGATP